MNLFWRYIPWFLIKEIGIFFFSFLGWNVLRWAWPLKEWDAKKVDQAHISNRNVLSLVSCSWCSRFGSLLWRILIRVREVIGAGESVGAHSGEERLRVTPGGGWRPVRYRNSLVPVPCAVQGSLEKCAGVGWNSPAAGRCLWPSRPWRWVTQRGSGGTSSARPPSWVSLTTPT